MLLVTSVGARTAPLHSQFRMAEMRLHVQRHNRLSKILGQMHGLMSSLVEYRLQNSAWRWGGSEWGRYAVCTVLDTYVCRRWVELERLSQYPSPQASCLSHSSDIRGAGMTSPASSRATTRACVVASDMCLPSPNADVHRFPSPVVDRACLSIAGWRSKPKISSLCFSSR